MRIRTLSSSLSTISPSCHLLFFIKQTTTLPFSSLTSPPTTSANPTPFTKDYLIRTFGFTESRSSSLFDRFHIAERAQTPDLLLQTLRQFGFSEDHIRATVRNTPQILFCEDDAVLKPKLRFFQQLGLIGSDLGLFISKNSTLLTHSLDRRLAPSIDIVKGVLAPNGGDCDTNDLFSVLRRCKWIIAKDPKLRLLPNISFLQSCGIVGSQLSTLLKRRPILFAQKESRLRDLVRKVEDMGFSIDSRMFVHGLFTLSCIGPETLERKFKVFEDYGFSREEIAEMFRTTPSLPRTSEEKLKLGIEFFMDVVGYNRTVLVHKPKILMYSLEKRLIPRHRVFVILRSKNLLKTMKKVPSFISVVELSEDAFLDRFISRFLDCAEELLVIYKDDFSNL
ncbi:hypothetical protein Scep_021570 [Stephania cephalantha]|uniref:Uncharacterized protein n=1 Tax=Stephania cephalantha TaxID=152367 RepID=A0AAP0F4T8_9MAGN